MPSINELTESRFLKKDDVTPAILVTVSSVERVELDGDKGKETKWCLHFEEDVKPMILNKTNGTLIAEFLGSEEMNDWKGRQIVIYYDQNVWFAGKKTGGIRVREPKNQPAPAPKKAAPENGQAFDTNEPSDDVPY